MNFKKWGVYYPLGFMLIFASLTGCRTAEICALKWSDVDFENMVIHIHGQQIVTLKDKHVYYEYINSTKDEKGLSQSGRIFPLTDDLYDLLSEIQKKQSEKNIKAQYVFCLENGDWITVHNYTKFLRRICNKLNIKVTNNHGFRMALNSNVLIPMGVPVNDRASFLGHSVQTNINYYSYSRKNAVDHARELLNNHRGHFSIKGDTF